MDTTSREERAKLIEHMLTEVEAALADRSRSNDFVESIRDWFDRKGWLSEKQFEALKKFYGRV